MVIIRLSRGGSKNRPFFNVVVADSRNPLVAEGEALRLQLERVSHWQSKGAQLSDTVAKLVKRAGAAVAA
jgi:small subunit ribosomal protein S16